MEFPIFVFAQDFDSFIKKMIPAILGGNCCRAIHEKLTAAKLQLYNPPVPCERAPSLL